MAFKVAAKIGGDTQSDVLHELGIDSDDPGYNALKRAIQNWGSPACITNLVEAIEDISTTNDIPIPWHYD